MLTPTADAFHVKRVEIPTLCAYLRASGGVFLENVQRSQRCVRRASGPLSWVSRSSCQHSLIASFPDSVAAQLHPSWRRYRVEARPAPWLVGAHAGRLMDVVPVGLAGSRPPGRGTSRRTFSRFTWNFAVLLPCRVQRGGVLGRRIATLRHVKHVGRCAVAASAVPAEEPAHHRSDTNGSCGGECDCLVLQRRSVVGGTPATMADRV